MPRRYGLYDLLTLAFDLFAPILDPLFGGLDDAHDEPEPPPSADPLVVVPAAAPEVPLEEVTTALRFQGDTPVSTPKARPLEAVSLTEPLYVRRGTGRGARYDVAGPDASGQRYRRQVAGRRTTYTPVEARR